MIKDDSPRLDVMDFNLAEASIFMGNIQVARQQIDCIRFSYITPSSRTPCHYQCQPDLVEQLVADQADKESERLRVQSVFNSTQYGKPTYVQLTHACADEIMRGAEDESEMGVFHDLYQPQRGSQSARPTG